MDKNIEAYIDDMVVKSKVVFEHMGRPQGYFWYTKETQVVL